MKKIFCIAAILCTAVLAHSQALYEVTYKAPRDSQMIYLINAENRQVMDSARAENGKVFFRGAIPQVVVAALCTKPSLFNDMITFILDNEPLELSVEGNGMLKAKGSPVNQRYADYKNVVTEASSGLQQLQVEYMKLLQEHNNVIPDSMMVRLEDMYDAIAANIDKANRTLVEKNKDNLIPLFSLTYNAEELGYDYVEEYLKTYKYKDRECLEPVKETLEKEKCKMPGAKVINLTMPNVSGKMLDLTKYVGQGKYVLVDFWASWCGPCRKDMPNVKKAYNKYHNKGFDIVSISFDNNHEAWAKAVKDLGMKWHQMSDLKGWQSKAAEVYNIRAIPATILYAPDGTVVQANLRGQKLLDRLIEIFGE